MRLNSLTTRALLSGILLGLVAFFGISQVGIRVFSPRAAPRAGSVAPQSEKQLVAVLLITPDCEAAHTRDFKTVLWFGLDSLRNLARRRGYRPSLVAAALSANSESVRSFILNLGPFDEIVIGRGWLNTAALQYVWRDVPGISAVPQLVIVRRDVSVSPEGAVAVSSDSVVMRLTGAEAIMRWSRAGAPLDLEPAS